MEKNKIIGKLKIISSLTTGEEGDFWNSIAETLEQISNHVDIDDIIENVIFVFISIPAISKKLPSGSNIISFNLSRLREDIEENGGNYEERAKDIIAHECAHYKLGHYNKLPSKKLEEEADDLIEDWGFNRAYD